MNQIILNKNEIKSFKKIENVYHRESNIYLADKNTLYKILYPSTALLREQAIYRLTLMDNKDCILPKDIIFNYNFDFMGYSMRYLYNYQVSTKILHSKMSYQERLEIAKRIAKIIESFKGDDIIYWDLHPDNIMIHKNDIKIIDMDSVKFKDDYRSDDYFEEEKSSRKSLALLCLSYLSDMNIMDFPQGNILNSLQEIFSNSFKGSGLEEIAENIFDYPEHLINPSEFLDYLNEEDLIESKQRLIKKFI